LLVGAVAIGAVVALERGIESAMRTERETYPPVAVRLQFLMEVARRVGLEEQAKHALDGIDPCAVAEGARATKRDAALACKGAGVILGAAPASAGFSPATLPRLWGVKADDQGKSVFAPDDRVHEWQTRLVALAAVGGETLEAARVAAAGAWWAYSAMVCSYAPRKPGWHASLTKDLGPFVAHVTDAISKTREEAERADEVTLTD